MKKFYYIVLVGFILFINNSNAYQTNDPIPPFETFTIPSSQLNEERVINVWLPENYATSSESFPVMYMADGGVMEDFPHIASTLDKLIKEKKIKPILLVGIENTQRRRDLTGFTEVETDKKIAPIVGGSTQFRAFIKEELFPEIDKRYRTLNEKTIIGESASGLFVIETFFLSPQLFDNYIAFDPSLWWNNHYLIRKAKEHLQNFPKHDKRIWFAGSKAKDIAPYTKELANIFSSVNNNHIKWYYSNEPKEKHHTIFKATKEKAIIWTLSNK